MITESLITHFEIFVIPVLCDFRMLLLFYISLQSEEKFCNRSFHNTKLKQSIKSGVTE